MQTDPTEQSQYSPAPKRHDAALSFDARMLEDRAFWLRRLSGSTGAAGLPGDRPRLPGPAVRRGEARIEIAGELHDQLARVTGGGPFLLYTTLVVTLRICLYKYTSLRSITVGSPARRTQDNLDEPANAVVIADGIDERASFKQLLLQQRQDLLEAYARQSYPHARLIEDLQRSEGRPPDPLFRIAIALAELHGPLLDVGHDISFIFYRDGGQVAGKVEFNLDVYRPETIERLLDCFRNLLAAGLRAPDAAVGDLEALSAAQRHHLLDRWNATATDYPRDSSLPELFQAQVERNPGAVALAFGEEQVTYGALNRRANGVASRLLELGTGPGMRIGLCAERSVEMVVGILGILKAGAAYLPLDPGFPDGRLELILEDAGAPVLLVPPQLADRVPAFRGHRELLGAAPPVPDLPMPAIPRCTADDLAYVIYTSGSTGQPKGVAVPQRAVTRLVLATDYVSLGPGDRIAQVSPMSFDAATFELWGALLNGGCLVEAPQDVALAPQDFGEFLARHGITTLFLTTALFNQMAREAPWGLRGLRDLLFGGEAVDPAAVRQVLSGYAPQRLLHVYGPTESTTFATWFPVAQVLAGAATVPIGRPIANTRLFLLDADAAPVPPGGTGEIYLGGDGLARGYVGDPVLTAQRFVPDPFSDIPGARLYRTGDFARLDIDEAVEFLGRGDDQVKLRGFRIEPGEIESVLRDHPDIRETAVLVREDTPGARKLVAYVVPAAQRQPGVGVLRDHAAARLPSYMVPATFVFLERLPLNANGKVDRRQLPAPSRALRSTGESHVAPRTPVEQVLANLFSEVLGVDNVGIYDDFFVLGGHSLLATRVVSRLRETFHVELPIRELFENPTVIELAASVEGAVGSAWSLRASPIARVDRGQGPLPLSFAQQRLWLMDRFEPGSSTYNMFSGFRIRGPLQVGALTAAFREIVRRHEVLRTVFFSRDDAPEQVVLPADVQPERIDLRSLEPAVRELELRRIVEEQARAPFDLSRGPLLRLALVRTEAEEHVLLMTIHHIVSDAWSIGVLMREVQELYGAFLDGRPSPLPELPVQYADFSAWQRQWMDGQVLADEVEFWRAQLRGLPPLLELPTDHPRQAAHSSAGRTEVLPLPAELLPPLYSLCQRCGVTPFMVMLSLFEILLFRYCGEEAFAVGTPVAGRNRLEIEGLIGFFVNILVLRADLAGDPTLGALLERVRDNALEAYLHQDLPFEKLVEELQPERSTHHSALFQVMFALENIGAGRFHLGNLQLRPLLGFAPTQALYDLSFTVNGERDELYMEMNARSELFDSTTVRRMSHHLIALLAQAVDDPARPLDRFALLSDAERAQLVVEWNDTAVAPSVHCLHELFEARADLVPSATAVVSGSRELVYGELESQANQLAHHLRALGVGPEVPVGICIERTPEMIVALLAVLKAGGAYLPLDPSYPHSRLGFMIGDAGLTVMIGDERSLAKLPPHSASTVCFERDRPAIARHSAQRPQRAAAPVNLAYVAYTSGSLGTPKGVLVEHRSASRYVTTTVAFYGLGEGDRTVHFSSLSFDSSLDEIFTPLAGGATLVLATPDMVAPSRYLAVCREQEITACSMPTAFWHEISLAVEAEPTVLPPSLRLLCVGGEALSTERVRRWLEAVGTAARLINGYGPTEATVMATTELVRQSPEPHAEVPIGRPLPGVRAYVLGRDLSVAPVGVPGELCLGGVGIARGYLGRPELTAERFIADPYTGEPGGRLYRTGDFARWLPDGRLAFLGRRDHQVKIRGFRIELGEIESLLRRHPAILDAVVLARDDQPGGTALVAFLATKEAPTDSELKTFLGQHLPDFMIPHQFVMLDALPVTVQGKVDRPGLQRWDLAEAKQEAALAPRDHLELALALVWEELLGMSPGAVAVRDDFFVLGGHSLLAARLVAVVEERLGKQIPLHLVFQNPTVEQLASLLRASGELPPAPSLVAIQPRGNRSPLFWVHPTGGSIFCYLDLARHLGPDQPFYAFQSSGIDGRRPLLPSIEEMAACYVEELLAAGPAGPWRLGGWSMGGAIAFEMARQLHARGREVDSVTVLDFSVGSDGQAASAEAEDATALLIGFARDLGLSPDQLPDPAWLATTNDAQKRDYILQRAREKDLLPPDAAAERLLEIFRNNIRATIAFRPGVYPGAVTLLRAASPGPSPAEDPTLGWDRLAAGGVRVRFVPGDHFTLLREPNVQALAEVLLSL